MTRPAATRDTRPLERVAVSMGARSYRILVGEDILAEAGGHLAPLLGRPLTAIVSDNIVAPLHGAALTAGLDRAGVTHHWVTVPAGEQSKSFEGLENVLEQLIDLRIERGDTIIALGGGVVGDLAGLAASLLRRGVGVIHIPTTLLAQVDSAIGGKTAINSRAGKNLIGSFHQPRLVLSDIAVLDSLPDRELRAGYAEIVKYAALGDRRFFAWLEAHGGALLAGDRAARTQAVATCCRAKAAIVAADERETGGRALLNLGHSFGHALEAAGGYSGNPRHGEAVAVGMVLAFELSVRLGLCPVADAARLRRHLGQVGLPVSIADIALTTTPDKLLAHMAQDKKARGGRLPLVLSRGIGAAFIAAPAEPGDIRAVIEAAS